MVLTSLSLPSMKKIIVKECDHRLKAEYFAADLACKARSSIDQKNFEIFNSKIKLEALKAKNNRLSVYVQLWKLSWNYLK